MALLSPKKPSSGSVGLGPIGADRHVTAQRAIVGITTGGTTASPSMAPRRITATRRGSRLARIGRFRQVGPGDEGAG